MINNLIEASGHRLLVTAGTEKIVSTTPSVCVLSFNHTYCLEHSYGPNYLGTVSFLYVYFLFPKLEVSLKQGRI